MFNWLKEKVSGIGRWLSDMSLDWLPLSGMVVMTYMIQRGFAAISKAGVEGVDITSGMGIYFTATAFSALAIGFLSDRIKAHWLVGLAGVTGAIGILALEYSALVFGIGMGIAAAVSKMVPFLAPLKAKTTNIEALRLAPQAAAKNIGAAAFIFLFAALIKTAGFSLFSAIVAPLFAAVSLIAMNVMAKHAVSVVKWDLSRLKSIFSNSKFYAYGAWFAACTWLIYNIYPKMYGAFKAASMSRSESLMMIGILGLCSIPMRWVWAYIGDKTNNVMPMFAAFGTYIVMYFAIARFNPMIVVPIFFLAMSMVTQNMWPTAKKWFTKDDLGTAMGIIMIITYLIVGLTFGKW